MELDRNCSNCAHFDNDAYCALPRKDRKLAGYIQEPESVVCVRWEKRLSPAEAIDKAHAAEERALYAKYPRY